MSEVTNALHEILEYAANTNSAMQIFVDCFEGDVQNIRTTIAPTEEEKKDITEFAASTYSLAKAIDLAKQLDDWFTMTGRLEDSPGHATLKEIRRHLDRI